MEKNLKWEIPYSTKLSRESRNKDRSRLAFWHVYFPIWPRISCFPRAVSTPFYIHLHIRGHSAGRPCLAYYPFRKAMHFSPPSLFFSPSIEVESNRWIILSVPINPLNNLSGSLTRTCYAYVYRLDMCLIRVIKIS